MDALNALMRLQSYGVTEKEILTVYGFMNRARLENFVKMSRGPIDSLLIIDNLNNGSNSGTQK